MADRNDKTAGEDRLEKGLSKRDFLRYSTGAALAAAGAAQLPLAGYAAAPASASASENKGNITSVIRKGELSEKEIITWLKALRGKPFVQQSHFDVTSVLKIRTHDGIYHVAGVNVENIELTVGTCAEEGALGAAATAFGEHFEVLEGWVMGAPSDAATSDLACYPCGECRQRFAQYARPSAIFHIVALDGGRKDRRTREELLPFAFSFRDLGRSSAHAAPTPIKNAGKIDYAGRLVRTPEKKLEREEIAAWLNEIHSDARVSGADRSLILRLSNGAYVAGVKMENAAYPSSTTAMQVAVALMNAHSGVQNIEEIWTLVRYRDSSANVEQKDIFPPISGSVLQVVYQFAASQEIPVNIFNIAGQSRSLPLKELLRGLRTFTRFRAG